MPIRYNELMKKILSLVLFLLSVFAFLLIPSDVLALDLTEYIARPDFIPHTLSTGEQISFSPEGAPGPGSPARQFKNANYEQFFYGSGGIFRREDTSWAPLPGFGDALCQGGGKAIYTLDAGCKQFSTGQQVTTDGTFWAPSNATQGQTWATQTHQIVTIQNTLTTGGARLYCPLQNLTGYDNPQACNQSAQIQFSAYYPPSAFTFCTGIKNTADLIVLKGVSGPGTGDIFYYMKGYGLVGFEAPGFEAGLMGPGADASQCTGGSLPPLGTFDIEARIPCNETQDPEFHSLRPYPTNPCNPNIEETLFMCSQDMIIKEVFEVTPADATSCTANPDGSQRCNYLINSTSRLNVSLDNTYLPIMGNTELVPNAINRNNSLSFPQRMNEYASWYLNGIIQRAEEQFFVTPQNIYEIINLSGPLRKLLPRNIQTSTRIAEKQEGADGIIRHDQIVACTSGGDPVACYSMPATTDRMSEIPNNPNDERFSYIPYSSTEDRKGDATTNPRTIQPGLNDAGGPIEITNVVYNPAPNSNTDLLYFAHMQEVSELGETLQKTYAPKDQPLKSNNISDPQVDQQLATAFCEIVENRTNPGDDLYGELVLPNAPADQQIIGGTVSYDMAFYCDFPQNVPDPACMLNCQTNPPPPVVAGITTCDAICTGEQKCQRQSLIDFQVATNTPKAQEVWDRLVDGTMSVFRRMFPRVGLNTPVAEIKSIPGKSEGVYTSSNAGANIPPIFTETLAGDPAKSRSGQQASILFPHIGSVHEYFLTGIQEALRPYGYSGKSGSAAPIPPTTGAGTCQPGTNYCSIENLMPSFENNITKATNASQICQAESRSNPFALNNSCLWTTDGVDNDNDGLTDLDDPNYDGATVDYSVGLFQINILWSSRCPVDPISSWSRNPPSCSFQNMQALQDCVDYFQDPVNNIRWTYENSASGTNWNQWSTAPGCGLSTN